MANGDLALVFYCQYARYPVVEFVGSTNEKATIPVFRRVFDTYGVPKEIKWDNGLPLDVERFMQRIKKTARIAALEEKLVRDEVRRGVRTYRATKHATTGVNRNDLMFGRELRRKFPEVNRQPKQPMIRSRDREQKEKIKKDADKRRHIAVMKIKVGDTVLCQQERKNSLVPLYDPVPMVFICTKGAMISGKNNLKIRTRNYADWKLLKNGCRESAPRDDSDNEDTFDPDALPADNSGESLQGPEQSRSTRRHWWRAVQSRRRHWRRWM